MDVEFITKKGKKFKLSDINGFEATDFIVSSIEMEGYTQTIEGRHGTVDYGADYRERTITVPFLFYPSYLHDLSHGRDELFGVLTDPDGFYIRELRRNKRKQYKFTKPFKDAVFENEEQTKNEFVNGRSYFVRLNNVISLNQEESRAKGTLEFVTIGLPFAETTWTSLDLHASQYDSSVERYGLTDGINTEYLSSIFTTKTFSVWNGGNVSVEPESMHLIIRIREITGSTGFKLINKTTGQTFQYVKPITVAKNITLDGLNILDGVVNTLRDTNMTFIKLAPGKNDLELVTDGTFSLVSFEYKYYFK